MTLPQRVTRRCALSLAPLFTPLTVEDRETPQPLPSAQLYSHSCRRAKRADLNVVTLKGRRRGVASWNFDEEPPVEVAASGAKLGGLCHLRDWKATSTPLGKDEMTQQSLLHDSLSEGRVALVHHGPIRANPASHPSSNVHPRRSRAVVQEA